MSRHIHLVQTVHLSEVVHEQYIVGYPNLRSLVINIEDWDGQEMAIINIASLINLNPTIVNLCIEDFGESRYFWTIVSERLTQLQREPEVNNKTMDDKRPMDTFWDFCIRLESLKLSNLVIESLPTTASSSSSSPMNDWIFPCIRRLELNSVDGLNELEQLDLITRCPRLEDLTRTPVDGRPELSEQFGVLSAAGTWPRGPESSVHYTGQGPDVDSREGSCVYERVEYRSKAACQDIPALRHHFNTLTHLNIGSGNAVSCWMHQEILCSCPLLESFTGCRFYARGAVEGEAWVCLSIQVFKVHFVFGEHEDHLQPLIFERLSKLVRLRILGGEMYQTKAKGLDFRLTSGLGTLHTLGDLQELCFRQVQHLELEDLMWMIHHWPRLRVVAGGLIIDFAKSMALKRHLDEVCIDNVSAIEWGYRHSSESY